MAEKKQTKLDDDVTKPSQVAPGDGPADTMDPEERATSVTPNPGREAMLAGTVNAVKPLPKRAAPRRDEGKDRTETYKATRPDGSEVTVTRNLETGETSVK